MIILTKLDGHAIVLNEEQLIFAEKTPDTVLTLAGGLRLMVRESLEDIVARVTEYRRRTTSLDEPGARLHG